MAKTESIPSGEKISHDETAHSKKPWLTPKQQVEHLRNQGVRFDLISQDDAESYLRRNNNFFRLRSYRKGFAKVEEGDRKGQYANLDFKMLIDLSIVDMLLRFEMLRLTLDVEHFSKVMLLTCIEEQAEDGYAIVQDFLETYDEPRAHGRIHNRLKQEIDRGKSSAYIRDLIAAFPGYSFPVWAFQEIISFGTFIYFTKFCSERFDSKALANDFYLLQDVRSLRNACAHNNCIINEMGAKGNGRRPNNTLSQAVSKIASIGSGQRRSKLSNERLQQITAALFLHHKRASSGILEHRANDLAALTKRMKKNLDYYAGNNQIRSGLLFIDSLIQAWYPISSDDEEDAAPTRKDAL